MGQGLKDPVDPEQWVQTMRPGPRGVSGGSRFRASGPQETLHQNWDLKG